jgi:hypothetical protein
MLLQLRTVRDDDDPLRPGEQLGLCVRNEWIDFRDAETTEAETSGEHLAAPEVGEGLITEWADRDSLVGHDHAAADTDLTAAHR